MLSCNTKHDTENPLVEFGLDVVSKHSEEIFTISIALANNDLLSAFDSIHENMNS